jgi:hypothetical protein
MTLFIGGDNELTDELLNTIGFPKHVEIDTESEMQCIPKLFCVTVYPHETVAIRLHSIEVPANLDFLR